jgi:hypothetical protein
MFHNVVLLDGTCGTHANKLNSELRFRFFQRFDSDELLPSRQYLLRCAQSATLSTSSNLP